MSGDGEAGSGPPGSLDAIRPWDPIVVTAADAGFADLLGGLVASIRAADPDRVLSIGVLDLGLSPGDAARLAAEGVAVRAPGWDFDFPSRGGMPASYRAMTARPFLPRHFPGHRLVLWLDADCWVQSATALVRLAGRALSGAIAIVAEDHPAYAATLPAAGGGAPVAVAEWQERAYRRFFGAEAAAASRGRPFVNSGVFALRRDAPHWAAWQRALVRTLQREAHAMSEQVALNHALVADRLPAILLPASINWLVHRARPAIDRRTGALLEPVPPFRPLGVVHLTGPRKQRRRLLRCADGGAVWSALTWEGRSPVEDAGGPMAGAAP